MFRLNGSQRSGTFRRTASRTRDEFRLLACLRQFDGVTVLAAIFQWCAAAVIAAALLRSGVILQPCQRLLTIAALCVSGPLTCVWLLRAASRLRNHHSQRAHLVHCASHDELTGLPNRPAMRDEFTRLLQAARQRDGQLVCMYLDIDGLRYANTLLGYRTGDELLLQIVMRISGCLAPTDQLSRFGGDKFVILLHRPMSHAEINALAECIVYSVSRPQTLNGQEFSTGVSIGIACSPADASDEDSLLAAAERAMYSVKRTGRSSFQYSGHVSDPRTERNRVLAGKLQRALLSGGIRLVYQPIFSRDGRVIAAEALARWEDEEEGAISPGEFIPIAESTGLIVPLSKWVLRRACEQMKAWLAIGSPLRRIAVNISVIEVSRHDFVSMVERTLRECGLPASYLELEVTETALANDFESVREHLQALRQLGARISIDDFGTGYSSFSRLRDLEADTLKIDRSFVQSAQSAQNGTAVVKALIDMAHTLQLSVVAEGVETQQQLEMLRDMRCDELQGFLMGRPQHPEELARLLAPVEASHRGDVVRFDRLTLVPRSA